MSPVSKKKTSAKPTKTRAARKSVSKPVQVAEATAPPAPAPTVVTAPEEKKPFLQGVGRRKTATAFVHLIKNGTGDIQINKRPLEVYFKVREQYEAVRAPLVSCGQANRLDIHAEVTGGGLRGQSDAVRLGIARALLLLNPTFRKNLRKSGFLTRDPRAKERKKYGLKKARRAPQWQKR